VDGFHVREFQSTLPVKGATGASYAHGADWAFQSTLPVKGATVYLRRIGLSDDGFNPRSQ